MRIHDALAGALLAALGGAVIWYVAGFPRVAGQNYGPDLFPRLVGIGLVLFGTGLVLRGVRSAGGLPALLELPSHGEIRRALLATVYIVSSVLAVVFLAERLGSQILVFGILISGLLAVYRRPVLSLTLALGLTVAFDLIFRVLLRVPLPSGLLTGVL
ncbi:tripartite tricarboxylate transporter TctB family protein [Rhodovulum sp. YEN HP10]|uniref:tripartite tricarboxylate transporter TctB family protein n=1 Tax=Rhodovulum sp. HP10 TaxID=3387397 RepID=UPI0039E02722